MQWTEEYSGRRASPRVDKVGGEIGHVDGHVDATADTWAEEFNAAMPGGEWAREFRREQDAGSGSIRSRSDRPGRRRRRPRRTRVESPRRCRATESEARNPQFLNFMSRMSRGETVVSGTTSWR